MPWYRAIQNNTRPSQGNGKKKSGLTRHSYPCYVPCQENQKSRNLGGRRVFIKLYMPINEPVIRLLGSLLITCCVVSPQGFRLILFLELLKAATSTEYPAYVREWKTAMKEAYELAPNRYRLSWIKGRKQHERKDHSPVLPPGDRVSKKCTWKKRTWKIAISLGKEIYRVVKR